LIIFKKSLTGITELESAGFMINQIGWKCTVGIQGVGPTLAKGQVSGLTRRDVRSWRLFGSLQGVCGGDYWWHSMDYSKYMYPPWLPHFLKSLCKFDNL